jgi:hypothetical protein
MARSRTVTRLIDQYRRDNQKFNGALSPEWRKRLALRAAIADELRRGLDDGPLPLRERREIAERVRAGMKGQSFYRQ